MTQEQLITLGEFKTFPQKAKYLRVFVKPMTRKELANEINVSKETIYYYETACQTPSIKTMRKYSNYFKVDIAYIIPKKGGIK